MNKELTTSVGHARKADIRHSLTESDVDYYLLEIQRYPVLPHKQQVALGYQVQDWIAVRTARKELTETLERPPTSLEIAAKLKWTAEEVSKKELQGFRARQKLTRSNLRLVVSVAKRFVKGDVQLLDLVQAGTIGLIHAIERFDPSMEYHLSTYAYWWIRQRVQREFQKTFRSIRLSVNMSDLLRKVRVYCAEYYAQHYEQPGWELVQQEFDLSDQQILLLQQHYSPPYSLDQPVDDGRWELIDTIEDDTRPPALLAVADAYTARALWDALRSELTPKELEVLTLRFGLSDNKQRSLERVGQLVNLGRERVRQIENKALRKLRRNRRYLRDLCNYDCELLWKE